MGELTVIGLRVVREAAAHGSFSAAADALGYTQSAVSRQIAAMEAAVDAPLFERVARGVRPTEAGAVLAEHAASVLVSLDSATSAIARIQARLEGRLTLGAIPAAMPVLVPRAVARVLSENPSLEISLREDSSPALVSGLHAGHLDAAVIALGADLPTYDLTGLRRDLLMSETLRIAVPSSHRLATRTDPIPVAELTTERWIIGRSASPDEPTFTAWPTLAAPRIAFTAPDWPSRLGLVSAGLGIALIPAISAPSVPAGVTVLEVEDPKIQKRSATALTRTDAPAAARATVAALRTEAATIALARR
jgi:DNA-binding transcriptional LysR family regulator